jgi:hypothetical protein
MSRCSPPTAGAGGSTCFPRIRDAHRSGKLTKQANYQLFETAKTRIGEDAKTRRMKPQSEVLIRTIAAAIDGAAEGNLAEGYAALRVGLERALERRARGERGGNEEVARWCWACEWSSGRYGVRRDV